jgi:cytochrome c553
MVIPSISKGVNMKNLSRHRLQALGAAAILLCATVSVQAQPTPPGRLLASNCFQCHGTNGKGPGFDTLAGKSANELYKEMVEFKSGKEGNGIMAKHSMGYTDAQLRQLAQWLSTQR